MPRQNSRLTFPLWSILMATGLPVRSDKNMMSSTVSLPSISSGRRKFWLSHITTCQDTQSYRLLWRLFKLYPGVHVIRWMLHFLCNLHEVSSVKSKRKPSVETLVWANVLVSSFSLFSFGLPLLYLWWVKSAWSLMTFIFWHFAPEVIVKIARENQHACIYYYWL